jgi:hypothetical protein
MDVKKEGSLSGTPDFGGAGSLLRTSLSCSLKAIFGCFAKSRMKREINEIIQFKVS